MMVSLALTNCATVEQQNRLQNLVQIIKLSSIVHKKSSLADQKNRAQCSRILVELYTTLYTAEKRSNEYKLHAIILSKSINSTIIVNIF